MIQKRFNELKFLWASGKLETAEQIAELCHLEAQMKTIPCSNCGQDVVVTNDINETVCETCQEQIEQEME